MIFYFLLFISTTFLGYLIYEKGEKSQLGQKRGVNTLYFLIFLIYLIFIGCRDVSVGSDTLVYENKFIRAANIPLIPYLSDWLFSDPGFYTFTWLIRRLTNSVNVYFIIISAIYFAVFLEFIRRYAKNPMWGIWLLNSLGFTTFALSTLRQSLAMAFCLLAYMLWQDRKCFAWVFLLLAFAFHSSSVVFLPMMFVGMLLNKKFPWKLALILVLTVIIAPYAMNYLMLNIEDGFYEQTEVGGMGMIVLLLLLIVLGMYTYFPFKRNLPITHYYEYVAICFALASFLVTRFNLAAMRLFLYYLAFAVVFVPNMLDSYKKGNRQLLSLLLVLITTYYLVARVMADPYADSRLLLPYKFFWE